MTSAKTRATAASKRQGRDPKRKRLSGPERRELIEQSALAVFAERGYHGGSIDEIARRSGVTPPIVYDHFPSKLALHKRLLERTRDELVAMWARELGGDEPFAQRMPRALDAWARYVEEHAYAPRMFFAETTGIPEIQAIHREVQEQARRVFGSMLGREEGAENIAGQDPEALQMAAEIMRAGLTGLAIWWTDHPDVPRERIVTAAINAVWVGFDRVSRGESWRPGEPLPGYD